MPPTGEGPVEHIAYSRPDRFSGLGHGIHSESIVERMVGGRVVRIERVRREWRREWNGRWKSRWIIRIVYRLGCWISKTRRRITDDRSRRRHRTCVAKP